MMSFIGLKVLDGVNGYWVAMPNRKNNKPNTNNDENYKLYLDIAYPVTKEARKAIQDSVLTKYHAMLQDNPLEKNDEQKEYDKKQGHPSIDVSEDDLPF